MTAPSAPTPNPTPDSDAVGPAGSIAWRRDALTARRTAVALLAALRQDRELIRTRHARTGKRDPICVITGRSALDYAIDEVNELIASIDRALDGTEPAPVDVIGRIAFGGALAAAPSPLP